MAFQNITGTKLAQFSTATALTATVFTCPANNRTYVKDIDVCNTTAGSATASVYLVPSGVAYGTINALFYNVVIPAYSVFQWTGSQIINPGDFIQVQGSISGLVFNVTGGLAV
jgi:hypothetical protein